MRISSLNQKVRSRSYAPKNVAPFATTQIESQLALKRQSIRSGAYIFAKKGKKYTSPMIMQVIFNLCGTIIIAYKDYIFNTFITFLDKKPQNLRSAVFLLLFRS